LQVINHLSCVYYYLSENSFAYSRFYLDEIPIFVFFCPCMSLIRGNLESNKKKKIWTYVTMYTKCVRVCMCMYMCIVIQVCLYYIYDIEFKYYNAVHIYFITKICFNSDLIFNFF